MIQLLEGFTGGSSRYGLLPSATAQGLLSDTAHRNIGEISTHDHHILEASVEGKGSFKNCSRKIGARHHR